MDVYFFLKQRTDLIRHFYDAASAPFVETKRCIRKALPPFDNPPYDDSEVPAFLTNGCKPTSSMSWLVGQQSRCCPRP